MKPINIIILLCITLLFTTCKKYPEGGYIKRGPKTILGKWKLSLYEVNGIDSTDLINYNNNENYKIISFLKNASTISLQAPHSGAGSVEFINENKSLRFENNGIAAGISCTVFDSIHYCYRSFLIPEVSNSSTSATWTIEKLKSNEIRMILSQKNNYKITLTFSK